MGAKHSANEGLSDEDLDEYVLLTNFSRQEIKRLYAKFQRIAGHTVTNPRERIPANTIIDGIPELKFNPFRDRLPFVFSSRRDQRFSFDDFLDLAGAFDEKAPFDVKAAFAFQVFDYNDDQLLTKADLAKTFDVLTGGVNNRDLLLDQDDLHELVQLVFKETGTNGIDAISMLEFEQLLNKLPDFPMSFRFHL